MAAMAYSNAIEKKPVRNKGAKVASKKLKNK